jgi:DNA modification methylase
MWTYYIITFSKIMFYQGDIFEVLPKLKKYKLIFTSPPYWKGFKYDTFNSYQQYIDWTRRWVKEIKQHLEQDGFFIVNIANDSETPIKAFEVMQICCDHFRLIDTAIWYCYNRQPHNTVRSLTNQTEYCFIFRLDNSDIVFNKELVLEKYKEVFDTKNVGNVWRIPFQVKERGTTKLKKSIGKWGSSGFPELLCNMVLDLTTKEGDNVLDCFCGTKTLLRCGEKMGRNVDGIDLFDI